MIRTDGLNQETLGFCLFAAQIFVAMASGFGINGKKGRCYDVWMDFSDCMTHCVMPAECTARRDDYFECLHHRKEVFSLYPSAPPTLFSFALLLYPLYSLGLLNPSVWFIRASWWDEEFVIVRSPFSDP
jgi:hypothetical protein